MNKIFGALLGLLLLLPGAAQAANCSAFSYTLTNGSTADANQVMSNFNNLLNCANNNLAHNGANSDITSLSGLSTPLSQAQGGTGSGALTGTTGTGNLVLSSGPTISAPTISGATISAPTISGATSIALQQSGKGSTSCLNNTATTLFNIPDVVASDGTWVISAAWGTGQAATALVSVKGGTPNSTVLQSSGADMSFSVSGSAVQMTQTTGITETVVWAYSIIASQDF